MQTEFTQKAMNALGYAKSAAKALKQGYIGTEHILLGLLKEQTGIAAKVLADNEVSYDRTLDMIRELIAFDGGVSVKEREGYTPRAMKILDEAHAQAKRFGHKQTGTEHILMALIKENENVALRLLNTMEVSVNKVYAEVLQAIGADPNLYKEDLG